MKPASYLILLSGLLGAAAGHADVVKIPVGQQAAQEQVGAKPRNGMDKAEVAQRFGEPRDRRGPVGDPPISVWDYGEYVVYFEQDTVLHTVAKHQPQRNL